MSSRTASRSPKSWRCANCARLSDFVASACTSTTTSWTHSGFRRRRVSRVAKAELAERPRHWIAECRRNGILPGLWFGTNMLVKIDAAPAWKDSLSSKKWTASLYEGGFLSDFMETLQYWYDRGIRFYKFDFADFSAATPKSEKTQSPDSIRSRNETAFREALRDVSPKESRRRAGSVQWLRRRRGIHRRAVPFCSSRSIRGGWKFSTECIPAIRGHPMFRR